MKKYILSNKIWYRIISDIFSRRRIHERDDKIFVNKLNCCYILRFRFKTYLKNNSLTDMSNYYERINLKNNTDTYIMSHQNYENCKMSDIRFRKY